MTDKNHVNPPDDEVTRKVYEDLDKYLPHGGSIGRWNDAATEEAGETCPLCRQKEGIGYPGMSCPECGSHEWIEERYIHEAKAYIRCAKCGYERENPHSD